MQKKLTTRQTAACVKLAAGANVAEAAADARVSTRTIFRWLQTEMFRECLADLQRKTLDQALTSLQGASARAVDALVVHLDHDNPWIVHAAAMAILGQALKGREQLEFTARLEKVEDALKLKGGTRTQWQDYNYKRR